MGIKIDKISVKDLGPIKSFSARFGMFNLIYSRNEKGKTFLTEFIICSLFKNIGRWCYLRKGGKGKITISGLEKEMIDFSPLSGQKLEDYWETSEKGLPVSMAKLLVVKGGETGIEDDNGISKFLVKEVLSGINVLDKIDRDSNISKTIKKVKIEGGKIEIPQIGEGKVYTDALNKLDSIERQFEEIESEYTLGILRTYRIKEKALADNLALLDKAKRHKAFLVSEKIKELDSKLKYIPDDGLRKIENELSLYKSKKEYYNQLDEKYKNALEKSRDFKWLESALPYYKDLSLRTIKKPGNFLLILCGLFAAAGIAAAIILFSSYQKTSVITSIIYLAIVCFCFLGLVASSFLYIKKFQNFSKQAGQSVELNKIKKEFKTRIGKELSNIALLESALNEERGFYSESIVIKEQAGSLNEELLKLNSSINHKIEGFTGKEVKEKDRETILKDLQLYNRNIKDRIDTETRELYKLAVPETNYISEDIGTIYNQQEYEKTRSALESIREGIKDQEDRIQRLKIKICEKTGDDLSISWEDLIENLRLKRFEVQNELKEITANIAAGYSVHRVISRLREEEDTKIQEGLQSKTVLTPLREITGRYNKLSLDNARLIVSDQYDDFDIRDLSTGAKEQVMLALRIGFTSKILKEDTLFLILDDAFQHSDWQKREILINKLADIASKGWQVIYLTMDDNIKELFDKTGKKFEAGKYSSLTL
jgi:hypothetical protein